MLHMCNTNNIMLKKVGVKVEKELEFCSQFVPQGRRMRLNMKTKTIGITGAGSGLGKMAALELAKRGHTVYAFVHYESEISDLLNFSKVNKLSLFPIKCDILQEQDRKILLSYSFDVFICNAAIGDSGAVCETDLDRIKSVFETNVFGNIYLSQKIFSNMFFSNLHSGRIIFVSSLVALSPIPFLSPYCASKSALYTFSKCFRLECKLLNRWNGSKIEISTIMPGAYATGFNMENIQKKYTWMKNNSFFSKKYSFLMNREMKLWSFLEQTSFNSIIKQYVRTVEDKRLKKVYSSPWWQTLFSYLLMFFFTL